MKKIQIVLLSLGVVSCAHRPNLEHKTVQFPYAADLLKTVQSTQSRMPASIEVENESAKSVRRVYFTSLYHQYLTLGELINNRSALESCPQFHHDKLEAESFAVPKLSVANKSQVQPDGQKYFPELAFNKNFSLKDYHSEMRKEVETLCEEGLSDNFYKFDNLVTHYSNKKSFHRNESAMTSVLKIPVFANFYLLKMISNKNVVSFTHPEEGRFIELTQTKWFENYVVEASRLRNNYMKNKMVQR